MITNSQSDVNKQLQKFEAFRRILHAGGSYGHWWVKTIEGDKRTIWWPTDDPAPVPAWGANVYFNVHPTSEIPTTKKNGEPVDPQFTRSRNAIIQAANALFADFDVKDWDGDFEALHDYLRSLDPMPSVVVFSGGGFHAYWLFVSTYAIENDRDRERITKLQRAWNKHMAGADAGVNDLARVLRVPGTHNYKDEYAPEYPLVRFFWYNLDRRYSMDELEGLVSDVIEELTPTRQPTRRGPITDVLKEVGAASNALQRLAPWRVEDYDSWYKVGMALSELGDFGLTLWDEWSQQSDKYEPGLCDEKWMTWEPGHGLTLASLIYWANQDNPVKKGEEARADLSKKDYVTVPSINEEGEFVINVKMSKEDAQYILQQPADDHGNAMCVLRLYPNHIAYVSGLGWLAWNGKYWQTNGAEALVGKMITAALTKRRVLAAQVGDERIMKVCQTNNNRIVACKTRLKDLASGVTVSMLDSDPFALNVENGIINLRTGELRPHDPLAYMTSIVPVEYDPDARCEEWERFIRESLRNERRGIVGEVLDELVEYFQTIVGYSITGSTKEEIFFYIYGPTRSGKGTFTEVMMKMLGYDLGKEVDFQTFTQRRDGNSQNFDLAGLRNSRFVTASESSRYDWLDTNRVKVITGGNAIRAAFKYQDMFEYRPQFKVWLTSNSKVQADTDDLATWGRARVIEFPNSKLGQEDTTLKSRLKEPENLRGILAWAVQGAIKYARYGKKSLPVPDVVRETVEAHRDELDYVSHWMEECVEVGSEEDYVESRALYESYVRWCKDNGIDHPKGIKNFLQSVALRLPEGAKYGVRKRVLVNGKYKQRRCVTHIKNVEEPDYYEFENALAL